MKWVKQSIHYWCPDTKEHKFLGQNVTVAILDTGISPHPDFKDRILSFRDFSSTTGSSEKVLFSFSHFSPLIDNSGHGTHVAGILAGSGLLSSGTYAGIAPFCNLIIGKVLDQNGNGSIKNVINGIQWIRDIYTQFHIRIINISVGTRPDLSHSSKTSFIECCRIPLGSWTRRSCLCRQLRTCSRFRHSSRKQPKSYHCWCSRHFSSDPHPKASSQLFRPRSYR